MTSIGRLMRQVENEDSREHSTAAPGGTLSTNRHSLGLSCQATDVTWCPTFLGEAVDLFVKLKAKLITEKTNNSVQVQYPPY